MTDVDRLEQRLAAVERVVVDGDASLDELATLTALEKSVSNLDERLEEHERRLAELEAAVESVQGYVGAVDSVSDEVERRADSAVATVARLEHRVEALEVELDDLQGGILTDGQLTRMGRFDDESGSNQRDETDDDEESAGEKPPIIGTETPADDGSSTDGGSLTDDGSSTDDAPTAERSVETILEGVSGYQQSVDGGTNQEGAVASQPAVNSALEESTIPAADHRSDDDGNDGRGLLDGLRMRFS